MAGITYTPNPGFEASLLADPLTKAALKAFADTALAGAQAAAPVLTGRYRASLAVDDSGPTPALISTSSFWGLIEYGSVHNPPFAPLRRGVSSAGITMTG